MQVGSNDASGQKIFVRGIRHQILPPSGRRFYFLSYISMYKLCTPYWQREQFWLRLHFACSGSLSNWLQQSDTLTLLKGKATLSAFVTTACSITTILKYINYLHELIAVKTIPILSQHMYSSAATTNINKFQIITGLSPAHSRKSWSFWSHAK